MQLLHRLQVLRAPGRRDSLARLTEVLGWHAVRQRIVRLVLALVLHVLGPEAAPAGHGRGARDPRPGLRELPINVEVLPVPSARPGEALCQPDAALRTLLASIRLARASRTEPGQVGGLELELCRVLALLKKENAPAHELSGMTQLIEQLRQIQCPASRPGAFETGMFWMLLEREVRSMVERHDGPGGAA